MFYLSSPGSGDVASQPVLLLSLDQPPVLASVPNYDTDRDDDTGLLLKHNSGSESEQLFRLELTQAVQLQGVIPVELFASARNSNGSFTLDVRLRSCRGTDCTEVAYRRVTATSTGVGFVSMTFDLVPIATALERRRRARARDLGADLRSPCLAGVRHGGRRQPHRPAILTKH